MMTPKQNAIPYISASHLHLSSRHYREFYASNWKSNCLNAASGRCTGTHKSSNHGNHYSCDRSTDSNSCAHSVSATNTKPTQFLLLLLFLLTALLCLLFAPRKRECEKRLFLRLSTCFCLPWHAVTWRSVYV